MRGERMIQTYETMQLKLERMIEKRRTAAVRLTEMEERLNAAKAAFEKETADVEKLAAQSLSTFLRSLVGTYEKKLDKEKKEQVAAKMELDTATALYLEAQNTVEALDENIEALQQQLASLRDGMRASDNPAFHEKLSQEEQAKVEQQQEADELEEALHAGDRVLESIDATLEELDSASSMATWDMFSNSSFFVDMMKYNKLDRAEKEITYLERTLEQYRNELKDVDIQNAVVYEELDQMSRTFDMFFDNIFSDWNTRETIQRNIAMLEELGEEVEEIQGVLTERKALLEEQLRFSGE